MPTKESLEELAISEAEYEAIVERLGREPNDLELGLFGSLWSEHCAYKHSKPLLRMFAVDSPRLLVAPGEENAGAIDIGDGLAIVMKIESHNHPSAIEPYEGAATGVGGIVRDIFAMGARPIALMNSLRFGPLEAARNSYLFGGVVAGISGYGNCIGVPNVGGEVVFADSYSGNPLVNAMCVGILPKEGLISATTGAAGNVLMLIGADTGRDGIHGASGLASRTFEEERELRPAVQVGNPFLEKVLIEACLELVDTDHIVGLQDLGAAGLSTASVECASKGSTGLSIDVSKIPRREEAMSPYEIMLSESQERMLVIVKPGHEEAVEEILNKWDLQATAIGVATDDGYATITENDVVLGELPVRLLTDAPMYRLQGTKPEGLSELQGYDFGQILIPDKSPSDILLRLLGSPNIASKRSVYRQYDHQVQTNTVISPGGDAAIIRVKGTSKGIALATDGNGRKCYLNPYVGGMLAVAEACRNVSVVGATPIALTDCLNFGNPEKSEIYYQLEEAVKGMSAASDAFNSPVVSGNVSLYNETQGEGIYPTPVVGALGLLENVANHTTVGFKKTGDAVVLIGDDLSQVKLENLAGSEYLELVHGLVAGNPSLDIDAEVMVQNLCRRVIQEGLVSSAHDCSDGGLAVALAESCIQGGIGFSGKFIASARWDVALFGEGESRIILSLPQSHLSRLENLCEESSVNYSVIGTVGGQRFIIDEAINLSLGTLAESWENGLDDAVGAATRI
tara:strand:- start:49 stop:2268 length:2220 start_codon:yes stop_codon:yes gene_type:complete